MGLVIPLCLMGIDVRIDVTCEHNAWLEITIVTYLASLRSDVIHSRVFQISFMIQILGCLLNS